MADHTPVPAPPDPARPAPPPAPTPEPADAAPADLVPPPGRWERLAWYAGAMLLSCALVAAGLRLDAADLAAPFYYDLDSLLIIPLVRATVERGFGGHWGNERMGAPGVLELHDFPVIDHLHFLIIWALGQVVSNLLVLYNLYFLLTFPLTVLTAMIAFRHLGLTLPAAAVGGLLYSFLPYHYQRWENHYFLAAYWMVPLGLLPAFAVCRGDLPFFRRDPDGTHRLRLASRRTAGLVVLALAVASAGAYYAFFTCAVTAFAGAYAWVSLRTWRGAASAGGVIALVVAFGLVNHIPTFVYQAKFGKHPITDRYPEEADHYGLKVTHLVLPIEDHNLRPFNRIKWLYNSAMRPAETENRSASLGLVGAAGLVGLVAMVLLPVRRRWPYGPLAGMTLFTLLLATIGGFGSVFNLLVTAQIRGYNRVSVFVAFFCLLAALWAADRFLLTRVARPGSRTRRLRYPAWAALFLVGFLDQTPHSWFRSHIVATINEHAERFRADARFFGEVERRMPAGSKVFCMPYCPFPETAAVYRMPAYEHARAYFHTGGLVTSFGSMKGREADAWQREVAGEKDDELIRRVAFGGFDGLLIDGRGFPTTSTGNRASALIAEANRMYSQLAGRRADLPLVIHEDRGQFFLDLRPYRDLLRQKDPNYFEAHARKESEYVALTWLEGFYSPVNEKGECSPAVYGTTRGSLWVVNPTDRTRVLDVRMTFGTDHPGAFRMKVSGLIDDEFDLDRRSEAWKDKDLGVRVHYVLKVPPGRHLIRFRCTPPDDFIPNDTRKLCFYVINVHKSE